MGRKLASSAVLFVFAIFLALVTPATHAQGPVEVALAGFAYSGSETTIDKRFPYSRMYEHSRVQPLGLTLFSNLSSIDTSAVKIVRQFDELKGRDQAVAVALVIGSETVSHEQFGSSLHKLLVLIRGQTMFFDFKSMNVIRSYPISFAYIDTLDHPPSEQEILQRIEWVYQGVNGKAGILQRFSTAVANATIPKQVPRYLQITSATVKPEALEIIPDYINSEPGAADTWLADLVGEAISTRAGVPIIPYAKGYAIGNVMSMRVSDGTVWELQLPKPDYEIRIELTGFKRVTIDEVAGGATSVAYGVYANVHIEEPLSKKVFLSSDLKNGETRVISASQQTVDEFPYYYDSVNQLFVKLATAMSETGDDKWLTKGALAADIKKQIKTTKELIGQCK